ncbi:MAG: HlyD family type I secretion periplasmic adaptor subunit, partial [Alphaproteobacteria bacterium]|nr:HlyD family type I secretion periplasmic adaptor subunit [Alphaproteobacteria bacterium]
VSLLLIASLVKVDIVVTGTGHLTTDIPPIMLQPMDRAIIREMNVKAGDIVTKGQVLATLDPTFAKADLVSLTAQQQSLQAELRRIESELNGTPYQPGNPPNADETLQATLYHQRQDQYKSRLLMFDEEIKRIQANIQTTEDNRSSLTKQMAITKDVEEMRLSLMNLQTGSKLQYLDSQAVRMKTERELRDSVNRPVELRHEAESKLAERQAFIDEWRRQLLENLVTTRNEATKVGVNLAKTSFAKGLLVVTSPADGVVLDTAKRTVGSVLREAEPLVTIVPSNAALIAEIMIPSGDVGYVKEGDEVLVKVDAFPYQRHGWLVGYLSSVSEESFSGGAGGIDGGGSSLTGRDSGGAFHRGRVELGTTRLEHMPSGTHLIPGMTLTSDIKIGSRTIIGYILTPITQGFTESLREP